MTWFEHKKKPLENPTPVDERRVVTEGLWTKCNACRAIIWKMRRCSRTGIAGERGEDQEQKCRRKSDEARDQCKNCDLCKR